MIALSASRLWPLFFLLAWMQFRFQDISLPLPLKIPLFGNSAGYAFIFFLFYLISYNLLNFFKGILLPGKRKKEFPLIPQGENYASGNVIDRRAVPNRQA
jgi:hypothetical protein